jgi:hypothetical protein
MALRPSFPIYTTFRSNVSNVAERSIWSEFVAMWYWNGSVFTIPIWALTVANEGHYKPGCLDLRIAERRPQA